MQFNRCQLRWPGLRGRYRRRMLESVYLALLIFAFVAIGAMGLFILYKLFAGQE